MKMIRLKIIKSILKNKRLVLLCSLVIAIGLMAQIGFVQTSYFINSSLEHLYSTSDLADVFVTVKGADDKLISKLMEKSYIKNITGETVIPSETSINKKKYNILLTIRRDQKEGVNKPCVIEGRYCEADNEMIISKGFAKYHNLNVGDSIQLKINGVDHTYNIAGYFMSPLLVYASIPNESNGESGYAYINSFKNPNGLNNTVYNELSIKLKGNINYSNVRDDLKKSLATAGLVNIHEKADEESFNHIQSVVNQFKVLGNGLAIIIFIVGSILAILILSRIVLRENTEIAILKSLGYSSRVLSIGYTFYGVVIGLIASIAGTISGCSISLYGFYLFRNRLALPAIKNRFNYTFIFISIFWTLFICILSSYITSRKINKMNIIDAFNMKTSHYTHNVFLQKVPFIWDRLSMELKYALRNMLRKKRKCLLVIIMLNACILISSVVLNINFGNRYYNTDLQKKTYKYDLKLQLKNPVLSSQAYIILNHHNELKEVNVYDEMPIEIISNKKNFESKMAVLSENNDLYGIYDNNGKIISMDKAGIVICEQLANTLGVKAGDTVCLKNAGTDANAVIAGLCTAYTGDSIFINDGYYNIIFSSDKKYDMIYAKVKEGYDIKLLKSKLLNDNNIENISSSEDMIQSMVDANSSTEILMDLIAFIGLAVSITIFIALNSITLSERIYEIRMLKILGKHPSEITEMIMSELLIISVPCIITGCFLSSIVYKQLITVSTSATKDLNIYKYNSANGYIWTILGLLIGLIISTIYSLKIIRKVDISDKIIE